MYLVLSEFDNNYNKHNEDVVMLHSRSLIFSQQQELISNGARVLKNSDVILSREEAEYQNDKAIDIYKRIMKSLTVTMNEYNGTNHDQRFWTLTLGRKIWNTICSYLITYLQLKIVVDKYKDLKTTVLDLNLSNITNCSYEEYYSILWNYLVPSSLIRELDWGIRYDSEGISYAGMQDVGITASKCRKSYVRRFMDCLYKKFYLAGNGAEIIIDTPYVPEFAKVTKESSFRIRETTDTFLKLYQKYEQVRSNRHIKRNVLNEFRFVAKDEIERVIGENIFSYIPTTLTDHFREVEGDLLSLYCKCRAKVVGSANSFWYNDIYNLWSAHMHERGAKVVAIEHGAPAFFEYTFDFEHLTYDWYMGWGNKNNNLRYNNFLPGVCLKQLNCEIDKPHESSVNRVLYLENIACPYIQYICRYLLVDIERMINLRFDFFEAIGNHKKLSMTVRMINREEYMSHRFEVEHFRTYLNLDFHSMLESPYQRDIKIADICVTDSIQTVWAELLSINKPIILLISANVLDKSLLTEDAVDIIKRMKERQLVFFEANELVELIESISNLREWWYEPERQSIVEEFCFKYSYLPEKGIRYRVLSERIFAANIN